MVCGPIKVIGVEPIAAPTLKKALAAGHPVDAEAGGVAADSLAPRRVGDRVFPIAAKYVRDVLLVADDPIVKSQTHCGGDCGLLPSPAEPRPFPHCYRASISPHAVNASASS